MGRIKFKLKFRNKLEENLLKIPLYFIIGALALFFIFKIVSLFPYIALFVAVVVLRYLEKDDILNYIYGGAMSAFLVYSLIGFVFSTSLPIVVVVSSSMQHDNPQQTFYGWLQSNLGYNKTYIDSWPFSNGFSIGDMPVLMGSKDYTVGDIIVYDTPCESAPIIHRVIKMNADGTLQTKGDNNPGQIYKTCGAQTELQMFDERNITMQQIRGKVIFIIPKIGYIKIALIELTGVFK